MGFVTLLLFLLIEAHRYRGYDVWRSRVRLIQQNVLAHGLDPSHALDDPEWRRELASDYRQPTIKIPLEEAIAHRLRRVYGPLLTVVVLAWIVRVTAFARNASWPASAAIDGISGTVVTATIALVCLVALVVAVRPREWHSHSELRTQRIDDW